MFKVGRPSAEIDTCFSEKSGSPNVINSEGSSWDSIVTRGDEGMGWIPITTRHSYPSPLV